MNLPRALCLFFPLVCSAQIIHGNVKNGTTGKPESGHEVILFTAAGEQARATTNDNGDFQINSGKDSSSHSLAMLQVIHKGVEYFQAVRPGRETSLDVYEPSSEVKGITGYLSILQFQVRGKLLQVTELHALSNESSPPITRVDANNLVLSLPDGAQIRPATVSGPDGGTTKLPLIAVAGTKGQYRIEFPIKPGLTKYAISYEVPYSGGLALRRQVQYPVKRVGVIVPESMHFRSLGARRFRPIPDQPGTSEHVLNKLAANETFRFELSGAGELAEAFRPSNPGDPVRSGKPNKTPSATWPLHSSLTAQLASANPRAPTGSAKEYLTAGIGMCVLAAIVLWRVMLRRNVGV